MLTFWWSRVVEVEAVQHPAQSVAAAVVEDSSNLHRKEFCCNRIRLQLEPADRVVQVAPTAAQMDLTPYLDH
jgi:hypothetical protein